MLSWTYVLENIWYEKFPPIKLPWDSTPMSPEECWEERLGSDSAKPLCKVRRLLLRASNFPESSMDWLIAYSSIRRSDSAVEKNKVTEQSKRKLESWRQIVRYARWQWEEQAHLPVHELKAGNWQTTPWPPPLFQLLEGTRNTLQRWCTLSPGRIVQCCARQQLEEHCKTPLDWD